MRMIAKCKLLPLLLCALLLCSCLGVRMGDQKKYDQRAETLLDDLMQAIQNNDKEALRSLFAQDALNADGFEQCLDDLLEYCGGYAMTSYHDWGLNTHKLNDTDDGGTPIRLRENFASYDVQTDGGTLRIAFAQVLEDAEHPSREGLLSLYVIKSVDGTNPEKAYRGDGLDTCGINIAKAGA